ncbi:caspase family protein [Shinella zoogloeoides]|uniref:caspase family protein n=1 Tax=Shinella zoogloeoides TaxID=352475 RepID=UPI00273F08B2|nr:caspase family protein [Shinella zoogloeoides]WLR95623.1 caspase family protein [Shinella zoogloeoides]
MQRFISCAFAMLILAGSASAAMAEERFALLIGNSRYEVAAPLRNPENDIEMVAAALEKSGFSTRKATNVRHEAVLAVVDEFVKDVEAADNPVVVVYFAGHGVQLDGENYLLAVDVKVGSSEEIKAHSLALGQLSTRLDALDSRLQIIVLDSCRDNPFEDQTRGLQRGLAEAPEKLGKLIAFSTSPGNVASDGDTGASPYASALAESIQIPGLALEGIFKRVRATVKERTGGKQEPWENSAVYGDFRFVEKEADGTQDSEIAIFEFAALADSQEAYQKYLARFPTGMFASLAKQKIEFMDRDFSFRRQNETFQYVTFENDYDDRCGAFRFNNSDERLHNTVADGELVLMKFLFWMPSSGCAMTSYFRHVTQAGKTADRPEAANLANSDVFARSGIDLTLEQARRVYSYFDGGLGRDMSGIMFRVDHRDNNDYMGVSLMEPTAAARENLIEIGCEDDCVYFQALMRFKNRSVEEGQEYEFEFVSAADLGLTWKYQNTLRKVAEIDAEKQKKEIEVFNRRNAVDGAAPLYDPVVTEAYRKARTISGWDIVAVVENNTFKNCRAFRPHRGAVMAFFRRYPAGETSFGFFDPSMKFPYAFEKLGEVRIDDKYTLSLRGRAYSEQEIAYGLGSRTDLVEALKAGSAIIVDGEGASLAGSKAMLGELEKCVAAFAIDQQSAEDAGKQ